MMPYTLCTFHVHRLDKDITDAVILLGEYLAVETFEAVKEMTVKAAEFADYDKELLASIKSIGMEKLLKPEGEEQLTAVIGNESFMINHYVPFAS